MTQKYSWSLYLDHSLIMFLFYALNTLVLGPVSVHVSWVEVLSSSSSCSLNRKLHTGTSLCPPHQQSQWTGSKGHWQVHQRNVIVLTWLTNFFKLYRLLVHCSWQKKRKEKVKIHFFAKKKKVQIFFPSSISASLFSLYNFPLGLSWKDIWQLVLTSSPRHPLCKFYVNLTLTDISTCLTLSHKDHVDDRVLHIVFYGTAWSQKAHTLLLLIILGYLQSTYFSSSRISTKRKLESKTKSL